jgi:hypothetical protein
MTNVGAGRPAQPEEERRTMLLSVPLEPRFDAPLKLVARREGRSVSGHIRFLILKDLQDNNLVDEDLRLVVPEGEETA